MQYININYTVLITEKQIWQIKKNDLKINLTRTIFQNSTTSYFIIIGTYNVLKFGILYVTAVGNLDKGFSLKTLQIETQLR